MIKADRPKSDFTNAPEGQHVSVCCDVVDLGYVEMTYKDKTEEKRRIRLVFQVEETDPDNDDKRFIVSAWFNFTLGPKSNLRAFLETWRGKAFKNDDEAWDFDVEKLLGVPALIQIVHVEKNDNTYANISTIMGLPKGMKAIKPDADYIRVCDREDEKLPDHGDSSDAASEAAKDGFGEMPEALTEPEVEGDVPF